MQQPRIVEIERKLMAGHCITTSLAENATFSLWSKFRAQESAIKNKLNTDLYSVEIFEKDLDFRDFTPQTQFEKWAAVEVSDLDSVPEGMKKLTIEAGLYAVFIHHGPARAFPQTAQYIHGQWMPQSGYQLDDRPHFEIMTGDYKGPNHPEAEEEIWVPIKKK
ncbi:GyrI-like domain-containing protein [Fulvivirga lutimaris]|uniref:GyrI-like domain-containing protein n=1 Tax=Fulvivirga lutimaris TaxID=1819566 RepID=UPI0012BB4FE4|nr:GyrI-like domain-containing protein [Fulvivirga lutimaris]MTI41120.1 AraC family transcriptional regulator [Fulvivirga lutimaris]